MDAPDLSVRIDQAQDALARLRVKISKISRAQQIDIYASTVPFVRGTKDMLAKVIETADVGFIAYGAMVAAGAATGGVGLLVIPFVAYGEDKWKSEADDLSWRLTRMTQIAEAVDLDNEASLLPVIETILTICRKSWDFYGKFSDSFYKMAADLVNACGRLLDRLLEAIKAVLNFVGEALKGATNTLAWVGPLLTILIPIAALGGLVYLARRGVREIREADPKPEREGAMGDGSGAASPPTPTAPPRRSPPGHPRPATPCSLAHPSQGLPDPPWRPVAITGDTRPRPAKTGYVSPLTGPAP